MRLTPFALLALAACSTQPPADNGATGPENAGMASPAPTDTAAPLPPVEPAAPGTPGGLDNDMTPVSEAPFTEDSAQGAANVVQTYYALLEAGKYGEAYKLWEPGAAGMSAGAFAASFAKYREYHAQIGAPGDVDAGAGQRYVTVPVQVYGRLKEGNRAFNMRGDVILHRTADVDGATAEQKKWHIRETTIKPRPGGAAPAPQPTVDNRSTARFRCFDGSRFTANFDPDNATVTIVRAGKSVTLRQQRMASGIRYSDGRTTFAGKGDAMTLSLPGRPPLACSAIRR